MRTFVCSLLFLLPALLRGQTGTEPRQIEAVDTLSTGQSLPSYEDWIMVSMLDTIGVDDYRYHHARLNLPHLFINMDDSICFVLYEGADTFCVAVPEGTGVTDSTYQWILTVNGGAPDTITVNETVNLVAGTNITITQGATDVTFNVPDMRDTCLHSLTQLTDTTAQLTDCNGANRGIITFSSDQCIQDMVVANGIGSDTIFLTNCDGTNKDTVVFYPPTYNDSYIDSVRYEFGDSLTVWLLRVDTSGVIDSVAIYIPVDSINTDTQLLSYIQNGQFDTISISNGNSIYLFDQDSQTLNITDDTLYISRGNNVDLKPYLDNDTVPDYDFLIIGSNRVPDQPADIDSAIYSGTGPSKRVRIGQDSLENVAVLGVNGGVLPFQTWSTLSSNQWRQFSRSSGYGWYRVQQSNGWQMVFQDTNTDPDSSGIYMFLEGGYLDDNPLFTLSDGNVSFSQYPYTRIDGTIDSIRALYYPGKLGDVNIAPIDSMQRALADWDFVQLMDGDTSYYGSNQKDSLLPLTASTLDSLLWRPGVIRLGDTIAFKRGYDPAGFGTGLRNTYKPQLQIHNKINGLDIYHWFYPYIWLRNNKGDWSFRTHNQDTEVDSLPHYYEIGVESYYKANPESDPDTTYRQVVRISSQANSNAFVLYQDSLQLSDYTPDDTDSTITGAQIGAVFIPWTNGVVKLVSLDTLNAALNVAASTPNITLFDRYNTGDSIALNLNATPDTAFADLSWLKVSLTGDTLIQGGDTLFLPQGADSMGMIVTDTRVIYGLGNKTPGFESNFSYNYTDNILELNPGQVYAGQGKFERNGASGNIRLLRTDGAGMAIGGGSSQSTFTFDDSYDFEIRSASRANVEAAVLNAGSQRFAIDGAAGGITFGAYNSTNNTGTPTYLLGTDGSGNVVKRSFANVLSDIGAQPAGSYDNYSSWRLEANGSLVNNIFSGDEVNFVGTDSDITVAGTIVGGTQIQISIPDNAIQTGEITNGTILPVDLNATGAADEYILTYESTGAVFEWQSAASLADGDGIQDLTYSASTRTMQISNTGGGTGADATIPLFATGASTAGLVPGSSGATSSFLRGDGTWASAPGADEIGTTISNGNIIYGQGSTAADQDPDFTWNDGTRQLIMGPSGGNTVTIDGDAPSITSSVAMTVGTTTGSLTLSVASGGSIFIGSPGSTTINDDAFIGGNTADQLAIQTTASGVTIGHEANAEGPANALTGGSQIYFNEASGNLYIFGRDLSTSDIILYAQDDLDLTCQSYSLTETSDLRLKKDIEYINDPYQIISALKPATFRYKEGEQDLRYGYIAQDYQKVFPDDVIENDEGYLSIRHGAVAPYTVAAVQQLIKDNEQQAAQIKVLTDQINKLYDIVNKKK